MRSGAARRQRCCRACASPRSALQKHSLTEALREIDRCWRTLPLEAATLAPLYGRLLSLEDQDHDAALAVLQQIDAPDADDAALRVHALLQLRRGEDARRELGRALGDYCLEPAGLLACVAREVLLHPDTEAAGWFGFGPKLELTGELAAGTSVGALRVRLGDGKEFSPPITGAPRDGGSAFRFQLAPWTPGATLHLHCGGVALLGADRLPLNFGLDGRASATGRRITAGRGSAGARTRRRACASRMSRAAALKPRPASTPLPGLALAVPHRCAARGAARRAHRGLGAPARRALAAAPGRTAPARCGRAARQRGGGLRRDGLARPPPHCPGAPHPQRGRRVAAVVRCHHPRLPWPARDARLHRFGAGHRRSAHARHRHRRCHRRRGACRRAGCARGRRTHHAAAQRRRTRASCARSTARSRCTPPTMPCC